ncbi:MAG: hypothetical protein CMH88_15040 [Oceanibulbus sp.]|jgi:hypothetical protein|nr:hypothetical protein [Sulfitobacter sp.]|tara:strand:- start:4416 stop:4739 length:324 start_codon:yes stop_codon:yes gene_type:complete
MTNAIALAAVQEAIATDYPDRSIELIAQVHHIRPDDIAHVEVYGCQDTKLRRSVRTNAVILLERLGIHVELIGSHDVFTVAPDFSDPVALKEFQLRLAEQNHAAKRS